MMLIRSSNFRLKSLFANFFYLLNFKVYCHLGAENIFFLKDFSFTNFVYILTNQDALFRKRAMKFKFSNIKNFVDSDFAPKFEVLMSIIFWSKIFLNSWWDRRLMKIIIRIHKEISQIVFFFISHRWGGSKEQ